MSQKISVGIDIGTYHVKVMICEYERGQGKNLPRIIGMGTATSHGMRHGYVVNVSDVSQSVREAVSQAEKSAGVKAKKAFISLGGIGLQSFVGTGAVAITRADSEISELDMGNALEACEKEIPPAQIVNRKIIHSIPLSYKIDGKTVHGQPLGMKGMRLETKVLFISVLEQHLNDLMQAVEEAGVDVVDVTAAPLAASLVTISKAQKVAGCVLANIGAETASIVVFENNIPISLEIFPIGSNDITNDIALGFKIPLDEAEQVKIGSLTGADFPRKKLEEIILARLTDIFELIDAHLKKIGRNALLPAGIIITGGGSTVASIEELAKTSLKLPAKLAALSLGSGSIPRAKDSSWSVVYGLCILGLNAADDSSAAFTFKKTRNTIISWFKQFLP